MSMMSSDKYVQKHCFIPSYCCAKYKIQTRMLLTPIWRVAAAATATTTPIKKIFVFVTQSKQTQWNGMTSTSFVLIFVMILPNKYSTGVYENAMVSCLVNSAFQFHHHSQWMQTQMAFRVCVYCFHRQWEYLTKRHQQQESH